MRRSSGFFASLNVPLVSTCNPQPRLNIYGVFLLNHTVSGGHIRGSGRFPLMYNSSPLYRSAARSEACFALGDGSWRVWHLLASLRRAVEAMGSQLDAMVQY